MREDWSIEDIESRPGMYDDELAKTQCTNQVKLGDSRFDSRWRTHFISEGTIELNNKPFYQRNGRQC